MDKTNDFIRELFEPIGGKARTFFIDYRDSNNNYFSNPVTVVQPPNTAIDTAALTKQLMQPLESKGYTVYSIIELLEGCTQEKLEKLIERDPGKAREYMAHLYLDFRNERA